MKKAFILAGVFAVISIVATAESAPRLSPSVTKTSINEGDTRTPIGISVSSTGWTQVLATNVRRRNAVLQTLSTAAGTVCLSTTTTESSCSATTKGYKIEVGGVLTDYSEAALNARLFDATSGSAYVYGMEYHDSGDSSSFQ